MEDALFTSPSFPVFGGAALIDSGGRLIGIGSLIVPDAAGPETRIAGNMFVPINALKPILGDLLAKGRAVGRGHPWVGVYTAEKGGHLFVRRVADDGPAARAGIRPGDITVSVAGQGIAGQVDFYRKLWADRKPGAVIELQILRSGAGVRNLRVTSGDRYDWLNLSRGN